MSFWHKTTILLLFMLISLHAETKYFCQKYQSLLSACATCTAQKNCDANHQVSCSKLSLYAHKCTTEQGAVQSTESNSQIDNNASRTGVAPTQTDVDKADQYKKATSPFSKRWQSIENDLNVVIPDQPIPAPGMQNKPGNPPADTLKKPNFDFIFKR